MEAPAPVEQSPPSEEVSLDFKRAPAKKAGGILHISSGDPEAAATAPAEGGETLELKPRKHTHKKRTFLFYHFFVNFGELEIWLRDSIKNHP